MNEERFPPQREEERSGGQHGLENTGGTAPAGAPKGQPSRDPQLRRTHDNSESGDRAHTDAVGIEDGGARHRQQ